MSRLNEIGELALIERICSRLLPGSAVSVGVGDDCAVVDPGCAGDVELVLTSDPVVCGVHFLQDDPAGLVGRKAVGRVLSDLAAMGASPRWLLVNVTAPGNLDVAYIDALYDGMVEFAGRYGAAIVGGDCAEGKEFAVHVFGVGSLPRGTALTRGGASEGDRLYVTGALGGSLASGRHLRVEPRVDEGVWLREWASAMIDVSDGLASDLGHLIAESGVGCEVDVESIPCSEGAFMANDARDAVQHALHDGEDFELLFSVSASRSDEMEQAWRSRFDLPLSCIGRVTGAIGTQCLKFSDGRELRLEDGGFRHFAS
jgi:thiamine-monophosphate kinase